MEFFQPKPPEKLPENLRQWAREMRGSMPDAEILLWKMLRNRGLADAKFRRQHPIENYILDFYCHEKKLCVEVDGGQHVETSDYDKQRDAWLNARGIRVLRFWNDQVLRETDEVLEAIYSALTQEQD